MKIEICNFHVKFVFLNRFLQKFARSLKTEFWTTILNNSCHVYFLNLRCTSDMYTNGFDPKENFTYINNKNLQYLCSSQSTKIIT